MRQYLQVLVGKLMFALICIEEKLVRNLENNYAI